MRSYNVTKRVEWDETKDGERDAKEIASINSKLPANAQKEQYLKVERER